MNTKIENGNAKAILNAFVLFCDDDKEIFLIRENGRVIAICQNRPDADYVCNALRHMHNTKEVPFDKAK